jgi:hypothetical protein
MAAVMISFVSFGGMSAFRTLHGSAFHGPDEVDPFGWFWEAKTHRGRGVSAWAVPLVRRHAEAAVFRLAAFVSHHVSRTSGEVF